MRVWGYPLHFGKIHWFRVHTQYCLYTETERLSKGLYLIDRMDMGIDQSRDEGAANASDSETAMQSFGSKDGSNSKTDLIRPSSTGNSLLED